MGDEIGTTQQLRREQAIRTADPGWLKCRGLNGPFCFDALEVESVEHARGDLLTLYFRSGRQVRVKGAFAEVAEAIEAARIEALQVGGESLLADAAAIPWPEA